MHILPSKVEHNKNLVLWLKHCITDSSNIDFSKCLTCEGRKTTINYCLSATDTAVATPQNNKNEKKTIQDQSVIR